jgi:hypothetical protein
LSDIPLITRLEQGLYTKDGDRYDHKADPRDVTGLCEADHQLRDQLVKLGYAVRWAIDGRYRLTDRGYLEMERRRSLARTSRVRGEVGEFEEDRKHLYAVEQNMKQETEEEKRLRSPTLGKEKPNE